MKTISKIGVLSLARIQAIVMGVLYLILGILSTALASLSPESVAGLGVPTGVSGIVRLTIGGIITGFLAGAVIAYLYNVVAPKVGGVQIELE
jgi:hypothetical protein